MKTRHNFNVKMATEIGINSSLLLEYLITRFQEKEGDKEYYYDGKTWFKVTIEFLNQVFPYMTRHSITKSIKDLKGFGYIVTRNSIGVCDRTKWYSVTKKGISTIELFEKRGR